MKQILYELKKTVFRKQLFFFFVAMCLVNIFFFQYHLNSINLYEIQSPKYRETFHKLHHEFDGVVTTEKAEKINSMYQELDEQVSSGTFNTTYEKDSLTGYIFQDYQLIKLYFHDPMMNNALYAEKMQDIVNEAQSNMHASNSHSYSHQYNRYIATHYKNRSVSSFYNFIGWQYLFDYQFSDILIILLLACCILPTFIKEKKSMMNEILDTTQIGKKSVFKTKILSIVVLSFLLVSVFAVVNLVLAQITIGIGGSTSPIYSIEEFSLTPYNCSILAFYLLSLLCKVIGFSVIGSLFLLITKFVKEYLSAFISAIAVALLLLFINGYLNTFSVFLRSISLLSPFHLINFPSVAQSIAGFHIVNHFVDNSIMAIIVQLLLFIVLMVINMLRKKGAHHVLLGNKKNSL